MAVFRFAVEAPDFLDDPLFRENAAPRVHQHFQKLAFLQGELERFIFAKQREGVGVQNDNIVDTGKGAVQAIVAFVCQVDGVVVFPRTCATACAMYSSSESSQYRS